MAPLPSSEDLDRHDVDFLLDQAHSAIAAALDGRRSSVPAVADLPPPLRRTSGAFVTLHVNGELNGCIGVVEGAEPLGQAIPRLALSAAFADPRLPALRPHDLHDLTIELSVLTSPRPIPARSWPELLDQVQPFVDGVIIGAGRRQGLFLPSVWEQLPESTTFLEHLYLKAGLTPRSWPPGMKAQRFGARSHQRPAGRQLAN